MNVSHEGIHISLAGVEGGHPADHTLLLVPDVEGPVLLKGFYVALGEPGEDSVSLDRADDLDAGYSLGAFGQEPGHGVGVGGVGPPQVVVEERAELVGHETQLAAAVEAGRRLLPLFEDGIYFVDLAPLRDVALVAWAIAQSPTA